MKADEVLFCTLMEVASSRMASGVQGLHLSQKIRLSGPSCQPRNICPEGWTGSTDTRALMGKEQSCHCVYKQSDAITTAHVHGSLYQKKKAPYLSWKRKKEERKHFGLVGRHLATQEIGHRTRQRTSKRKLPQGTGNRAANMATWEVALDPVGSLQVLRKMPEPSLPHETTYPVGGGRGMGATWKWKQKKDHTPKKKWKQYGTFKTTILHSY